MTEGGGGWSSALSCHDKTSHWHLTSIQVPIVTVVKLGCSKDVDEIHLCRQFRPKWQTFMFLSSFMLTQCQQVQWTHSGFTLT